jgi:hypothetical protein
VTAANDSCRYKEEEEEEEEEEVIKAKVLNRCSFKSNVYNKSNFKAKGPKRV